MTGDIDMQAKGGPLVVCIAEDRRSCECAVRLLVASLQRHCRGVPVQLFASDPTPAFLEWLRAYPDVTVRRERIGGALGGYNIKPQALMKLLDEGFEQVLWIDSDILVLSDFRPMLNMIPSRIFVATEEALGSAHPDPNGFRARLWGFPVGRVLPFSINSGVIRASHEHIKLLKTWLHYLGDPDYQAAQQKPWHERPPHHLSDQDVLTALLASTDFADVPVEFLKRGRGIVQYFGSCGYTVGQRLRSLVYGAPPFFHSQGYKPWWPAAKAYGGSFSERFNRLYQEVTPYVMLARPYRGELEVDDWLEPRSRAARMLRRLAFGQAMLFGLPLAVMADAVRAAKWVAQAFGIQKQA